MRWRTLNRRTLVAGAVVVVVISSGGGAIALRSGTRHTNTPAATRATGTATVNRTDLSTTQQVNGTLGFDGNYTVVNLVGATASQRSSAQQQLAQALAQESAANQTAADARASAAAQAAADQAMLDQYTAAVARDQQQLAADQDQLARDTAQQTIDCDAPTPTAPTAPTPTAPTPTAPTTSAPRSSSACTSDRTAVQTDTTHVSSDQSALAKDQQSVTAQQGKIAIDQAQGRQTADTAQGQANQAHAQAQAIQSGGSTTAPTTITAVPKIGDTIVAGQQLYALDGRPVILMVGNTLITRQLAVGVADGPDVAVLKQNLADLGFSPGQIDNHFDDATAAAVRNWQASLGETQDGVVHLGDVFTEPTAVRVTAVNATPGSNANLGGTVLTGTSTTPVVTVPLPPAKEYLVHVGDSVLIDLPDGKTTTTGHIRDMSTVATSNSSSGSSGGSGSGSGSGGANSTPAQSQQQGQQALAANSTINVTIILDNPGSVRPLDQAPVQVDITDQTVRGVLAVPVEALLALAGGGYGLQLVTPTGNQTVTVAAGLFGNGMVQVSGPGVVVGATVEVPHS